MGDITVAMGTTNDSGASPVRLPIGVVGIFGAFMYYGQLQGDIVRYRDASGDALEREWFLQVMEAGANVAVGLLGLIVTQGGPSPGIPIRGFAITGATQVLAKAMTQKAQIFGVPFFVATLVKNAKMVPVMAGAVVLSGKMFTNLMMLFIAMAVAMALDQFWGGLAFLQGNPDLYLAVIKFATCSAIGQSAIFFTIANFDPLVCTTVTTTRKIFSVLLDIVSRGHVLNEVQWGGIAVATLGVLGEVQEKFGGSSKK